MHALLVLRADAIEGFSEGTDEMALALVSRFESWPAWRRSASAHGLVAEVLKDDKRAVFTAASHAQKAADYLSDLQSAKHPDDQKAA